MKQAIKVQIVILLAIAASLTSCQSSSITCHYSCKTCAGESYSLCLNCKQDKNITIVQDPSLSQQLYINSNFATGVCISEISPKANALGIILIIVCSLIAIIVHTPTSIYLVSTLQTLSLLSFIQVAWLDPVNYLLQALQYFMLFNVFGSGYKNQDQTMRQRQYYRLDVYFHESHFLRNIAIVGIFNLILIVVIVALAIWKYRKDQKIKQDKVTQFHSQKSQKLQRKIQLSQIHPIQQEEKTVAYKLMESILNGCLTAFFLMIQQTSLVIMVSLRFQRPISAAAKGIPIIYCIFLLAFLIYAYKNPLWFSGNQKSQFVCIWRKIGLPVLVIVPYKITYILIIFMLAFILLQSFFDFRGGKFKMLSRIALFKLFQFLVVIFAGAYVITQLNRNLQEHSNIIRVFLAIGILAFFIFFGIQLFFGIIESYCTNNAVQNESQNGLKNKNYLNNTQQTINEIDNVFDADKKDKNVQIYDLQNQIEDSNADHNKNGLMILQTNHNENDDKDKNNKSILTDETDKAAKQEQQRLRRLKEQEQLARLKKLQEQEERARLKKLEQQRRIQEELERARLKKQQQQKKLQEELEKARLKKLQEQEERQRQRKLEQQKRLREQEQRARIKKQQEEEEQQRARKKRKYIAQMDPQLRKRYGF